jgi:hypothetical protein
LEHDDFKTNQSVMPGHSRSQNGVASLAYVPRIHVLAAFSAQKDVLGRDKPGHDGNCIKPIPISSGSGDTFDAW